MMTLDIRGPITRAEFAEALAVVREHSYIMNRIVMAALREDRAAVDALGLRLS